MEHVVRGDGFVDASQVEAEFLELQGIDDHLVLARLTAPRVDLADAAHGTQARADVPVVTLSTSMGFADVPSTKYW